MPLARKLTHLLPLAIILLGLVGYNFIGAQVWTSPTSTAPTNNTEAPINIGADYQAKLGDLGAVRMRAGEYCDATGTICSDLAASSTSIGTSVNASCAALPECGSAEDTDKFKDCRVNGGVNAYAGGGPLCVTRVNVTPAMTWGEASQVCNAVYGSGYRLPSMSELARIYNQRTQIGNIVVGADAGGNALITPWAYWSGADNASESGLISFVNMSSGGASGQYGTRPSNVRCVRGNIGYGQSSLAPVTYAWVAVAGSCVNSVRTTTHVCKGNDGSSAADAFCPQPKPANTTAGCTSGGYVPGNGR